MIEPIAEAPSGVVALRASGEVTAEDYRTVLEPALRDASESGEIRFLYVIEDGFKMTAGAMAEDARMGLGVAMRHHSAWKRMAVVSDVEWIEKALHAFAWAIPGDFKAFGTAELDAALDWVAG